VNEEKIIAEEYRRVKSFINDPMPLPWTLKQLAGFKNGFYESQKKVLDDYLKYHIKNKKSAVSQKGFFAEIIEYKYRLDIKLGFAKPYRQGMFDYFIWSFQGMLEAMINRVQEQLTQELQEESRDRLIKDIFDIAIRHMEEKPAMQETIDNRYEQCVKFIESPEIVPNSVQELLKANKVIGNPFEQIVDEKAIHDIVKLNTNIQHNDEQKYREQCIRILAENYRMKMEYNKKIGKAEYLKINAAGLTHNFSQDTIFLKKVWDECCYTENDERKVKAEYRDLDWDLLYKYVFSNLAHYMNKDVSEKLGILRKKGKTGEKKKFLLDIYNFYYIYYVIPAMKLKELQQDVCKDKLKELEDALDKKNNLISDVPVFPDKDRDPFSAYKEIVESQMRSNDSFYRNRFVSDWLKFQNEKFGGMYVLSHPKEDSYGFCHFKKYPPKTMDEIYLFCLMVRLSWDKLKKLTSYIREYYELVQSDSNSKKYQSLVKKYSFITPNYRTTVLKTVNLEKLQNSELYNDDYRRYKLIEWFFTEMPMIDYMQNKGEFSNAAGLIDCLNHILEEKGCEKLPVGFPSLKQE